MSIFGSIPLALLGDLSGEKIECGVAGSCSVFSIVNLMPLNLSLFFGEDSECGELMIDLFTAEGLITVCSELILCLIE